jgi:ribonuclease HI
MAKNKFYVVWEGKKPGIYKTWAECKANINRILGAKYKSFESIELAKKAFAGNYDEYKGKTFKVSSLTKDQIEKIGKPNLDSVAVDASCIGNPGLMEYNGVDTKTKRVLFSSQVFKESSNNIGEFLAVVHALALLKKNNDSRSIYSDSKIAIGWVKAKKCKTNIVKTVKNDPVFQLIERAENWLQQNSYTNSILKWETKAWGEIPADYGRK